MPLRPDGSIVCDVRGPNCPVRCLDSSGNVSRVSTLSNALMLIDFAGWRWNASGRVVCHLCNESRLPLEAP